MRSIIIAIVSVGAWLWTAATAQVETAQCHAVAVFKIGDWIEYELVGSETWTDAKWTVARLSAAEPSSEATYEFRIDGNWNGKRTDVYQAVTTGTIVDKDAIISTAMEIRGLTRMGMSYPAPILAMLRAQKKIDGLTPFLYSFPALTESVHPESYPVVAERVARSCRQAKAIGRQSLQLAAGASIESIELELLDSGDRAWVSSGVPGGVARYEARSHKKPWSITVTNIGGGAQSALSK